MADPNSGNYVPWNTYSVSSLFGAKRPYPMSSPHPGIDMAVDFGTPVYAAVEGNIIYAGSAGGFGNLVIVKTVGDDGEIFDIKYTHLLSGVPQSFKYDQDVYPGMLVGYVGM